MFNESHTEERWLSVFVSFPCGNSPWKIPENRLSLHKRIKCRWLRTWWFQMLCADWLPALQAIRALWEVWPRPSLLRVRTKAGVGSSNVLFQFYYSSSPVSCLPAKFWEKKWFVHQKEKKKNLLTRTLKLKTKLNARIPELQPRSDAERATSLCGFNAAAVRQIDSSTVAK